MGFWYWAFWYLFTGVIIDTQFSRRTKPALWSMLLWPIVVGLGLLITINNHIKREDDRDE